MSFSSSLAWELYPQPQALEDSMTSGVSVRLLVSILSQTGVSSACSDGGAGFTNKARVSDVLITSTLSLDITYGCTPLERICIPAKGL